MKTPDEILDVDPILRVLVVEDNPDDSVLLLRQLRKIQFSNCIKIIPDGLEAWTLLCSEDVSMDLIAIFLDLELPSLDGMELLRRIRANALLKHVPVFIMTSTNDPANLNECSRLGVEAYISKPITYSVFAKAMANLFHTPQTGVPSPVVV